MHCGCECDGVKSVERVGGVSDYIVHSKSCMRANEEAPECVHDLILSYGSEMSQEPGLPLIFEPISRLALDAFETPNLDLKERTRQDVFADRRR